MTEREFYGLVYSTIASLTPIPADCGELCGKKCCEGDKDGDGMYLFPGEEKLYEPRPEWAYLCETDFEYEGGRFAHFISCDGTCERKLRPLSCRIFPLLPYIDKEGKLGVKVDPRARGMCPMAVLRIEDFSPSFVSAVRRAGQILIKNRQCRAFLESLSRMTDEMQFL